MTGTREVELKAADENDVVINRPKEGEFYILSYDVTGGGRGHGVEFENEDTFVAPPNTYPLAEGSGFPPLAETPRLRYVPALGDMPKDLQDGVSLGYWLVSEPLKMVFESVDPEGFAFTPCEFILADGSQGPPHYLCDVVRTLDAVDETTSKIKIELDDDYPGGKYYNEGSGARFAFKKDVVGSAHVFLTPYSTDPFCDRILRDALIEHGFGVEPATRGVRLTDAAATGVYTLPPNYWPENR